MALGLSAFVWLPVLFEMKNVHVERLLEGYLQYSNHFVYLKQFLSTNWGFGLSVAGPDDGMSFSLGWSHVLMLIAAVVWALRKDKKQTQLGSSRRFRRRTAS